MVLRKNQIDAIFRSRTYGKKTVLTWRGPRRIKMLDKRGALRDVWDAFCVEFRTQRMFLETELARMREQIETQKAKSDADLAASAPGYCIQELRVLFRELRKGLADQSDRIPGHTSDVLDKIQTVLEQDYDVQHRIIEEAENNSLEQMERLRRRLERMGKDLQLSEKEVARLRGELAIACDGGVASIYKSVQGLADDAADAKIKKTLLKKLYKSNLEIRKKLT